MTFVWRSKFCPFARTVSPSEVKVGTKVSRQRKPLGHRIVESDAKGNEAAPAYDVTAFNQPR